MAGRPSSRPSPEDEPISPRNTFDSSMLSIHRWFMKKLAWAQVFGPHHSFTVEEREMMQQYESIDYMQTYSNSYRKRLNRPHPQEDIVKWLMFLAIGVFCGLLAFAIRQTIDLINTSRLGFVAYLMNDERRTDSDGKVISPSYFLAWLFSTSSSGALVFVAAAAVVYIWPPASGSGVEEVMAYLNGVEMPRVFNIRTMVVKTFSCIASVSSGLPVGPEGPLIHLGAICGAGLSQGRSKTLKCQTRWFEKFRNARDIRDFITAGAAAGVAAAFGAPIGGLLFVMEEMASHWQPSLTWMIFFCSMSSYCTVALFNSAFDAWHTTGTFGWFYNKAAALFLVTRIIQLNILAIFPSFIIGTFGGLIGAAFTMANVRINMWRRRVVNPIKSRRVLEPCVAVVTFSTLCLLLPLMFSCQPTKQGMDHRSTERYAWETENATYLVTFMCSNASEYNPMATLTLSDNEGTIRRLFSRNTDSEFGYAPLIVFFVLYFGFACFTAGTALSSGLLVPMIVMGATMGRLIGHMMADILISENDGMHNVDEQWIDPGVFALIGAAAFIAGVSRLTVSLTIIMLEISYELHFLLPIMLAVMTAKWVADFFTESLYHSLLHMKCVPILPQEPKQHAIDLQRHTALDAVCADTLALNTKEKVRVLVDTLRSTTHHCFPVKEGDVFRGTILRSELELLLQLPITFEPDPASTVDPPNLPVGAPRELSYSYLQRHRNKLFFNKGPIDWYARFDTPHLECFLCLKHYINRSPFTVRPEFSLQLTYELFTSMGLRHLVVLDGTKCLGIITRKDLLAQNLEDRLGPGALADYLSATRPTALDDIDEDDEEAAFCNSRSRGVSGSPAHPTADTELTRIEEELGLLGRDSG